MHPHLLHALTRFHGERVTEKVGSFFKSKKKKKEEIFKLDVKSKIFSVRVVRLWSRVPRAAPSLEVSKAGFYGAWSNLG